VPSIETELAAFETALNGKVSTASHAEDLELLAQEIGHQISAQADAQAKNTAALRAALAEQAAALTDVRNEVDALALLLTNLGASLVQYDHARTSG
jgi:hypothetical protein